jgi:hypothetical protein
MGPGIGGLPGIGPGIGGLPGIGPGIGGLPGMGMPCGVTPGGTHARGGGVDAAGGKAPSPPINPAGGRVGTAPGAEAMSSGANRVASASSAGFSRLHRRHDRCFVRHAQRGRGRLSPRLSPGRRVRVRLHIHHLDTFALDPKPRRPKKDLAARTYRRPVGPHRLVIHVHRMLRIHAGNEERHPIEEQVRVDLSDAVGVHLPRGRGPHRKRLHRHVGGETHCHLARVSRENVDLQVPVLLGHGVGRPACRAA